MTDSQKFTIVSLEESSTGFSVVLELGEEYISIHAMSPCCDGPVYYSKYGGGRMTGCYCGECNQPLPNRGLSSTRTLLIGASSLRIHKLLHDFIGQWTGLPLRSPNA